MDQEGVIRSVNPRRSRPGQVLDHSSTEPTAWDLRALRLTGPCLDAKAIRTSGQAARPV